MTVGLRIRALRKAAGLRQAELAKLAGIDQSTLSDIENGAGFGAETLILLAQALEASAEQIMLGTDRASWPFERVPLSRYLALKDAADRAYVEGKLEAAIETCELQVTDADRARMQKATGSAMLGAKSTRHKKTA